MLQFSGLIASDFAAYEPKKWSSNVFTLERMKVKEKFQALAAAVQPLFEANEFSHQLSDEHPNIVNHKKVDSQWLFVSRSQSAVSELARFLEKTELQPDKIFNLAPQEKHAVLAVFIDQTQVWVGVSMHHGAWVDRRNLAAKLQQPWHRERLKNLLSDLPETITLGFDEERVPAALLELPAIEALAETLSIEERRFVVARSFTAEEVIALGEGFLDIVKQTFAVLVPVYQFAAWSRENDDIAVGEKLQKEKAEQRKNATGFKMGERVRIMAGMFSGKVGVVQTVDTKSQVRVQVGAMAVNVSATDLVRAEAR